MSDRERYENRIWQILLILLALTMFSFWMLGGLYARYVTGAEGEDSARVASFQVNDSNTLQKTYELNPMTINSANRQFTVKITNNSETAVRYTFSVEKNGNLPLNIAVNGPNHTTLSKDETADVWRVDKAAGKYQDEPYTFTLSLDDTDENYQYAGGVESIVLTVKAEQID